MIANASPHADVWTLDASGLCSVAANWSLGVPVRGGAVVIAPTAAGVTLTFDVAGFLLGALTFENATTVLEGGALTVTKSATLQAATFLGPHALYLCGASQVAGLTLGGGATLYNRGALTQSGGPVKIGLSKTSRALVVNLAGATWTDSQNGGLTQGAGAAGSFGNRGTYIDSAGGLDLVGVSFASIGAISVAASGTLEFAGRGTTLSGDIAGGGLVDYAATTVANLRALTVTATNQTNYGVVNLVGNLYLQGAQTITDRGVWNFAGDVSMLVGVGESAEVSISGDPNATFNKTAGNGVSLVGASASLTGGVNVETGTLDFTGASNLFDGPITGAGTFEIATGANDLQATTLSVGLFLLSGGATTLQGAVTDAGDFEGDSGATLSFGGEGCSLTVTGTASLSGLVVEGSGSLTLATYSAALGVGTTAVSGLTIGGAADVVVQDEVQQTGVVTLGDAVTTNAARLTLDYYWNMHGNSGIGVGADPVSTITILGAGMLEKVDAGVSVVAPALVNDGLNIPTGDNNGVQPRGVDATAGTIDFKGAVSGTGSLNIYGEGLNYLTETTLEFDSGVGAGQNVVFGGVGGALYLTDLPDFHASISGFGAPNSNDSLLFGGGVVALGGATVTAASATLTLLDSNHGAHSLTLTGNYVGVAFAGVYANGLLRVT